MELTINSIAEIGQVAQEFINFFKKPSVIAFYGEMGVGKTTFIKELCKVLSCTDEITSPTFSIINEYLTRSSKKIYHFDLYRLENIQEAIEIGIEDYFYSGNWCFIEWPEIANSLLPPDTYHIKISETENMIRKIKNIK